MAGTSADTVTVQGSSSSDLSAVHGSLGKLCLYWNRRYKNSAHLWYSVFSDVFCPVRLLLTKFSIYGEGY